jgi:peptide subunit release factor 1 (eRF1)
MPDTVLTVVLDRAHTRFFEVTASEATELPDLQLPSMRGGKYHSDRQDSPGWGERDYHNRLREEERRHFRAVAQRLQAYERVHPAEGVVLAGPGDTAAGLRHALPATLAARVIGTARLNPTEVTPAGVQRATAELRLAHLREVERGIVRTLEEHLGTGRAENGTRAVLRALAKDQVQTLLVRGDVRGGGFRCSASGRLVLSATDCRGEGEPEAVTDVVGAVIEEARRRGATVVTIRDSEIAKTIDGMAAVLRFT